MARSKGDTCAHCGVPTGRLEAILTDTCSYELVCVDTAECRATVAREGLFKGYYTLDHLIWLDHYDAS
jgi:hypothetical protein